MTTEGFDNLTEYELRNLAWHLAGANHFDDLFKLLTVSNAFAEARNKREGDYVGYLDDLDFAWRCSETAAAWNLGIQVRCALIKSSIHSIADNISLNLLLELVRAQKWTAKIALSYASHMPDEKDRADAIAKIAPLLPAELSR